MGLEINSDSDSPLLQVAQSNTIETVRAKSRYTAEDDQSAWASEREVPLVFHVLEPTNWRHILVKVRVIDRPLPAAVAGSSCNTHCLYGLADTAE